MSVLQEYYISSHRFAALYNSCLSPVMFLYMVVCSFMLCASVYQTLVNINKFVRVVTMLIIIEHWNFQFGFGYFPLNARQNRMFNENAFFHIRFSDGDESFEQIFNCRISYFRSFTVVFVLLAWKWCYLYGQYNYYIQQCYRMHQFHVSLKY